MDEQPEIIDDEQSGPAETVPPHAIPAEEVGAGQVVYKQGFSLGVATEQNVTMNGAGAFGIAAGHDMKLSDGGAVSVSVGRDLDLTDGGAIILRVGGSAELTDSGSMVAICNEVHARKSTFGILISRHTTLGEGNTILLDTKQALAFGGALGAVFALLSWLLRKKT